jgi:hypothetical protein
MNMGEKLRQWPSLMVALFLQISPLVRGLEPAVAGVLQPVLLLMRWVSTAAAVAGGAHALSGATGLLTSAEVRGTEGTAMNYRAQITSLDHGAARSYSATGLPPGLAVTSRTAGIISGTPSQVGIYTASITGWENSNATGRSYSTPVVFTIVGVPPQIQTPPQALTVDQGGRATLSVTAVGLNLTYQWIQGDLEVPNGRESTLVLDPVKLSDAGDYVVRVRNSGGSILTDPVRLTVIPQSNPPEITGLSADQTVHAGEDVHLSVTATATGTTPTAFWLRAGGLVAGGETNVLTLPHITTAWAGAYQAVVTANGLSVTSAPVTVTVVPELRIGSADRNGDELEVITPAIPGRTYELQAASDPAATEWQSVMVRQALGDSVKLTESLTELGLRVFRVLVKP